MSVFVCSLKPISRQYHCVEEWSPLLLRLCTGVSYVQPNLPLTTGEDIVAKEQRVSLKRYGAVAIFYYTWNLAIRQVYSTNAPTV